MKIFAPQLHTTNTTNIDVNVGSNIEFRLSGSGDFLADGDVTAYSSAIASDETLKHDITPISEAIEKIKQLRGVEFKWNRDNTPSAGVIAQDVQQVLPSAVKQVQNLGDDGNHLVVNYNAIIGLLIEAIKDLESRIQ